MITRRELLIAAAGVPILGNLPTLSRGRLLLSFPLCGVGKIYFEKLGQRDGKPTVFMTFEKDKAATISADESSATLECFKDGASCTGVPWQWELK